MSQREKYAELFAAEAREHLSEMGRALVALEAEPGDRDSLDAVFRSVHTIKGMAAAMGYDVATRLAHNIESVLDELRSARRQVTSDVIDLLLESSDQLEEAVAATVDGREPADPSVTIEQLVLWRVSPPEEKEAPAPEAEEPAEPAPKRAAGPSSKRADASRVRVDIRRLDALMNLIGELAIVRGQLHVLAEQAGIEPLQNAVERAGGLISEMQVQVVESRMVPVWQVFDRFPRLVRDTARSLGKEVEIQISGKDLEFDRALLDAIGDPLVHLLRNSVDHGIESPKVREQIGKPQAGRIELSARRERARVVIVLSDDGRGIDRDRAVARARREGLLDATAEPTPQELFRILARPGFSTAKKVTTISGRGVGMDVVENSVRGLGGSVELVTEKGVGTTFRIELPLTIAIVRALIVTVAGQTYALPATFTRESLEVGAGDVQVAHGSEWITWRGGRVPLRRLQRLFANGSADGEGGNGPGADQLRLVALEFGGAQLAVSVDDFVGEEEIVVKSFNPPLGSAQLFSGATVRPDGRPALVIDVGSLS
jgi:two-component system chemotaxis sensor kinase CheA